jgi:hypothetical protein
MEVNNEEEVKSLTPATEIKLGNLASTAGRFVQKKGVRGPV